MPDKETIRRARRDARAGKAPSTQAGEFVREEIHHVRQGKHGARSAKQAIAIGLSKARRAGVKLPPKPDTKAAKSAQSASGAKAEPRKRAGETSVRRARASREALKKEPTTSVSRAALGRQARKAATRRSRSSRHAAAMQGIATKGPSGLRQAARKAAATRRRKER